MLDLLFGALRERGSRLFLDGAVHHFGQLKTVALFAGLQQCRFIEKLADALQRIHAQCS